MFANAQQPSKPDNAPVCAEPKIFIGQIPPETSKDNVLELCNRYGTVKSCHMPEVNGRAKGYAMVLFERWGHAENVVEAENGNAGLGGDRPLVVKFADPPKRGDGLLVGVAPKKLFVGQVGKNVTEPELRGLFEQYGTVVDCYILNKSSTCAFVRFSRWSEAEAAIEGLNGNTVLGDAKAPIVVKFADAKAPAGAAGGAAGAAMVGSKRAMGMNAAEPAMWQDNGKRQNLGGMQQAYGMGGFPLAGYGMGDMMGGMAYGGMPSMAGMTMGGMGGMGGMGAMRMGGMGMGAMPGMAAGMAGGMAGGMRGMAGAMAGGLGGITAGMGGMGMGGGLGSPPGVGKMGVGIKDPAAKEWKLFVGQLPFEANECDVWPVFSRIGEILELVVLRDNHTGRSKGCAFVTYANRTLAESAIAQFNAQVTLPGDTRGKPLVVKFASAQASA